MTTDDDVKLWLTLAFQKESRAAMSAMLSDRMTLSQHTVERLQKCHVPITDDSYKYSYHKTPDGYGIALFYCVIVLLHISAFEHIGFYA